jgi:hypothetical protein
VSILASHFPRAELHNASAIEGRSFPSRFVAVIGEAFVKVNVRYIDRKYVIPSIQGIIHPDNHGKCQRTLHVFLLLLLFGSPGLTTVNTSDVGRVYHTDSYINDLPLSNSNSDHLSISIPSGLPK